MRLAPRNQNIEIIYRFTGKIDLRLNGAKPGSDYCLTTAQKNPTGIGAQRLRDFCAIVIKNARNPANPVTSRGSGNRV